MERRKIEGNIRESIIIDPTLPKMGVAERLYLTGGFRKEGGMGAVEEVYDDNLKRLLVRKTILPSYRENPLIETRFLEEAQTAGQLQHPNIVPVHELGVDDEGQLFFTMKKIDGLSLSELVRKTPLKSRTWREVYEHLQIFVKVCDAVSFLHRHGVIHRDIKPSNIMIGEFGEVYLIDYGIMKVIDGHPRVTEPAPGSDAFDRHSRLVRSDSQFPPGDPSYASPEQERSEPLDERTDIYLLGGLLYFILHHRPPYATRDTVVMTPKPQGADGVDQEPSDIPGPIRRITEKAMAPDPADRFQTVAALKEAVVGALIGPWPCRRREFKPGTVIIQEGEPGHTAYVIIEGTCRIYKTVQGRKQPVGTLGPREVFGETALFSNQVRMATVEAAEPVVVEEIEQQAFDEGLPGWLRPFVQALARRFIKQDEQHAIRTQTLLEANIAVQVLRHMNLIGVQAKDGSRIAAWSELRSRVSDYFDIPGDVVHEAVAKRALLEINAKNDTAILREA